MEREVRWEWEWETEDDRYRGVKTAGKQDRRTKERENNIRGPDASLSPDSRNKEQINGAYCHTHRQDG